MAMWQKLNMQAILTPKERDTKNSQSMVYMFGNSLTFFFFQQETVYAGFAEDGSPLGCKLISLANNIVHTIFLCGLVFLQDFSLVFNLGLIGLVSFWDL